ncbi:DUF4199 family protein [Flavobacteriaceae bacterium Ap0902]|nr:DUF4199 family protein [Flavobacteriaceae bacterium Ap0902]
MLKSIIRKSAVLLFIITLLIFFAVQFFFKTDEYFQISDFQYILATSIANAFVITSVYALMGAYNMMRWTAKNNGGFLKVLKLTFLPGFIAGIMSLCAIFAYYYYVDPDGIELLKTQYLDYSLIQAQENGEYEEVAKVVNSEAVRNTNLLTYRVFTLILGIITFFNLSLGLMITFLWKIKTTPSKK